MLACLALSIALQSARGETVELAWGPEPGTVFERKIEFDVQGGLGADTASLELFGVGWLLDVSVAGRLRVRDEVHGVADGRPLALTREYEHLSTVWEGAGHHDMAPRLMDRPLRFTWDESARGYACAWKRPRSPDETPPSLREDLDLRAFLPGAPVRVGDVWRVPVSSVAGVLAPAGALHVDGYSSAAWGLDEFGRAFDLERVRRIRDGEVQCLLERVVRVDGRGMAVIEVGWSWWGTIDPFLTPAEGTWLARFLPDGIPAHLAGRAWGRLLWDLEGGHAREFELQAELNGHLGAAAGHPGLPIQARGAWFTKITPR